MAKHEKRSKSAEELSPLNREQNHILNWLKRVKFKRCLFGGLSERDVWSKMDKLNAMYNAALEAERIRFDTILQQYGISPNYDDNGGM